MVVDVMPTGGEGLLRPAATREGSALFSQRAGNAYLLPKASTCNKTILPIRHKTPIVPSMGLIAYFTRYDLTQAISLVRETVGFVRSFTFAPGLAR